MASLLPNYSLQALTDYLDLLGKSHIKDLPKRTGKPPSEDSQLFAGSLSFFPHHTPSLTTPILDHYKAQLTKTLTLSEVITFIHPLLLKYYPQLTPTLGYIHCTPMPRSHCPVLPGVSHPLFTRITPTPH